MDSFFCGKVHLIKAIKAQRDCAYLIWSDGLMMNLEKEPFEAETERGAFRETYVEKNINVTYHTTEKRGGALRQLIRQY